MLDEAFLRDFFGMKPAENATPKPAPQPRTITIECHAADPIEVRAENIVKMIGFQGGDGGSFSIPQINPAAATLRVITILRKYAEQDGNK